MNKASVGVVALLFLAGCSGIGRTMKESKSARQAYEQASDYAKQARSARENGNEDEYARLSSMAIGLYKSALMEMPDDPDVQQALGVQYFNSGDVESALSLYKSSLEGYEVAGSDEKLAGAMFNYYATLQVDQFKRYDEALAGLKRLLEKFPDHPIAPHVVAAVKEKIAAQ